jgi:CRP-like cAMP-binding protein
MADAAASTGAPSAGTAAPTGDGSAVDPKGTAQPAAWGDEDDAKFFELAKRSPYKAKIKGEDRAIDSKESLRELLNHAQRGIGATKLVEESKKEREAAAAERAEAQKERDLIRRARAGDFAARRELGLVPAGAKDEHEQALEQLPPEVRAVIEQNARLEAQLEEFKQQQSQTKAEQEKRAQAAKLEETRTRGLEGIKAAFDLAMREAVGKLGVTPETSAKWVESQGEAWLETGIKALADFEEQGLELGVDLTPEMLSDRISKMRDEARLDSFKKLPPRLALHAYAPALEALDDTALLEAVPPKLAARLARLEALRIRARKAQEQAGGGQVADARPINGGQPQRLQQTPGEKKPLSPFRW